MSKFLIRYPTLVIGYALLPLVASAQTVQTILTNLRTTLTTIIGILFVIATVVFLWGVVQFIANSGDEAARNKAKGIMTWGIIGLAVMAAAWGITVILITYFGVGAQPPAFAPPPLVN